MANKGERKLEIEKLRQKVRKFSISFNGEIINKHREKSRLKLRKFSISYWGKIKNKDRENVRIREGDTKLRDSSYHMGIFHHYRKIFQTT